MDHLKQFEHLKISLDVIKSATNDFADESFIGKGGFGRVYKGNIGNHAMVALKRLDPIHGQGDTEFRMEVEMLSRYKHENIVSLVGFCDDSDEKILIYPYAPKGSLDKHLNNDKLGWYERLKICIGAARGLAYLHNAEGTHQRVLHRDIKSSNILLDEDWNAMISDFGLSKLGPANQEHTSAVYSQPVGTPGYVDPLYENTGLLTKESDVYSFGVVLFEVLCGRLSIDYGNINPFLIALVRQSYGHRTIHGIVYGNIKDEINANSLLAFATIAYECLDRDRELRPSMSNVVNALETALSFQVRNDQVASVYLPSEDHAKALGMVSKSENGGCLVVTIHEGINLEVRHSRVMLSVGTETKFTEIKSDNQNPVWEESFIFTLEKPEEAELTLAVLSPGIEKDFDHYTDMLACINISIADVVKVVHMNNTYEILNGKIRVELEFLDYQDARSDPFSNRYFPSEERAKAVDMASKSEDAGSLVVTIHRGVNLNVKHPKVIMLIGTRLQQTTIKYNDHNPVWDETFYFTLEKPAEKILFLIVSSASRMDRFLRKHLPGGFKMSLANVVREKHKNYIYQIGTGHIQVELQFQHAA